MHKDFIYIPSSKVWLNVNHIVEIRLGCISSPDDTFRVTLSNAPEMPDEDSAYWNFNIEDLKYFEKIIGLIV